MIDRLSVNALLKSVIAILSAAVMVMLVLDAWGSWNRLRVASRSAAVANITGAIFTSLHNLRVDRSFTFRDLQADKQFTAINPQIETLRAAELPALTATMAALQGLDFPEKQTFASDLEQGTKRLTALHAETAAALLKPKAERRPGVHQDFYDAASAVLDTLDKLSSRLTRMVKLEDGFIDQLMELKQLAWIARNAGGDASVMVSNVIAGLPPAPDVLVRYAAEVSKLETAWAALGDLATGLALPAKFTDAVDNAKREYFAPEFVALRANTLKARMAGEPLPPGASQWSTFSVSKLATLLSVAEAAIDVAKEHAAEQRAAATWNLWLQLGLLIVSMLVAAALMLLVSRRVTGPLRTIQQAMLKLAGGDLSAEVSFGARKDEIGALANAMQTFKRGMTEAERLRQEQKQTEARSVDLRKAEMQRLANEFQSAVGNIVETVSMASTGLEAAARTLTKTAETTQQLSGVVASASEDASSNVQSVASAAEEMTSSVNEIARQVHESSKIAAEAVAQANKTDARITALSQAASRIGDVVKLITAIAEQTNLLALNATIEAARAGEAGRGFAVVAQEVKALAAQTAKATDEIGTQISSMQTATQDSVAAIKEIGGTIGRIAEIAATIAAAVEEQGAATQEISRNVQQAAQGTAQVATNITDVNRGASETGSASSQVLSSAQSLAHESGHLKSEVEKFVSMVRAA